MLEELRQAHLPDKAKALGIFLVGCYQPVAGRYFAHLRFQQATYGEQRPGELLLCELAQEIRLVFAGVFAGQQAVNLFAVFIDKGILATVMPGGYVIGPKL